MKTLEFTMSQNENYELINQIAEDNGLESVTTTSNRRGYPEKLNFAIIGFDSYEEAEELAKKNGMVIREYQTNVGWQLWVRNGKANSPYRISASMFGEQYNEFNADSIDSYYAEDIQPKLSEFKSLSELKGFIEEQEEILEAIDMCSDDEIVITKDGHYYETYLEHTMSRTEDSTTYAIGVEFAE